jgi:NH3-dependent NAD+ synthetase
MCSLEERTLITDVKQLTEIIVARISELGKGCEKAFVAVSGGIDSSTVAALLCLAYGSENVVGLYRDIRNSSKHLCDVKDLQKIFGFSLMMVDLNPEYDSIIKKIKRDFTDLGLPWVDEGTPEADSSGFTKAYTSMKSCFTTPLASFISKAIDVGRGRIFGTGNGEEDGLLRYFDKRGDGAVDNNILNGLTKAEVRQLARHLGVPEKIIIKTPSADLEGNGDAHNYEAELTTWAKEMGYNIELSNGAPDGSEEGNIAWAWKQDIAKGVITGNTNSHTPQILSQLGYTDKEIDLILFIREIEARTRHKVELIPGLERSILLRSGMVD